MFRNTQDKLKRFFFFIGFCFDLVYIFSEIVIIAPCLCSRNVRIEMSCIVYVYFILCPIDNVYFPTLFLFFFLHRMPLMLVILSTIFYVDFSLYAYLHVWVFSARPGGRKYNYVRFTIRNKLTVLRYFLHVRILRIPFKNNLTTIFVQC